MSCAAASLKFSVVFHANGGACAYEVGAREPLAALLVPEPVHARAAELGGLPLGFDAQGVLAIGGLRAAQGLALERAPDGDVAMAPEECHLLLERRRGRRPQRPALRTHSPAA